MSSPIGPGSWRAPLVVPVVAFTSIAGHTLLSSLCIVFHSLWGYQIKLFPVCNLILTPPDYHFLRYHHIIVCLQDTQKQARVCNMAPTFKNKILILGFEGRDLGKLTEDYFLWRTDWQSYLISQNLRIIWILYRGLGHRGYKELHFCSVLKTDKCGKKERKRSEI